MPVQITILSGTRQGETVELDSRAFCVGDARGDEIFFDPKADPSARGRRAELRLEDDGWRIRCLGFAPVLLNQTTVKGAVCVRSGDIVRMSETGPDFSFQVIGRKDVGQHVPDSVERASSVQQTQDVDLNESTGRSRSRLLGSSQDDSLFRRLRMPAALAVAIGFIAVVLAVRALPGRPELTLELPRLADQLVQEGETLVVSARVDSSQPISLPLAYRLGPDMPDGVRIDPTHGEITWTPSEKQGPGAYILTVVLESAGQQEKEYDRASFKVEVSEANRPPKIADLSPQTIDVHQTEMVDRVIAASDPDDPPNKLTFSLVSSTVGGAEIDAKTGRFTWTPSEDHIGRTFDVTVRVTDDGDGKLFDEKTFRVAVESSDPWFVLGKKAQAFVLLLGIQDNSTGNRFPFGAACAIGNKTLLTSAAVAVALEKHRRRGWGIWAENSQTGARVEIQQILIHAMYAKLSNLPSEQIYFDVAILMTDRPAPVVCPVASQEEMARLESGLQVGCISFAHDGQRLTRFDRLVPHLDRVDIDRISSLQLEPNAPDAGAPRLLFLSGQLPEHAYGSPILSRDGKLVAVYAEHQRRPTTEVSDARPIHYAPVAMLVAAWLNEKGRRFWIPPDVTEPRNEAQSAE